MNADYSGYANPDDGSILFNPSNLLETGRKGKMFTNSNMAKYYLI